MVPPLLIVSTTSVRSLFMTPFPFTASIKFPILTLPDLSATLPDLISDTRIFLPFCVKVSPIGFSKTTAKRVRGEFVVWLPSEGFSVTWVDPAAVLETTSSEVDSAPIFFS